VIVRQFSNCTFSSMLPPQPRYKQFTRWSHWMRHLFSSLLHECHWPTLQKGALRWPLLSHHSLFSHH
jgi:hypothetical protein